MQHVLDMQIVVLNQTLVKQGYTIKYELTPYPGEVYELVCKATSPAEFVVSCTIPLDYHELQPMLASTIARMHNVKSWRDIK